MSRFRHIPVALALIAITQLSCSDQSPSAPVEQGEWVWQVQNRIPVTRGGLDDIWASSPDDIFAVGRWGEILHFDGEAWDLLVLDDQFRLQSIWGSGPQDVYVLGQAWSEGVGLFHYDGNAWNKVELEGPGLYLGIWGSGPGDVYVGGPANTLHHFNGQEWTVVDPGNEQPITDICGSGPGDVYLLDSLGHVIHFDGFEWSTVDIGVDFGAETPGHIEAQSATSVLVGGRRSAFFDGYAWMPVDEIEDASFTMEDMCAADVYNGYLAAGGTKILFCDSLRWYPVADQSDILFDHSAFTGIWSKNTGIALYAVDIGGGVWRTGPQGLEFLNQSLETINHIGGSSENDVYAVGDYGSVMHYDGDSWSPLPGFTNARLTAVWAWSHDNVIVTTSSRNVYRYEGVKWELAAGPLAVIAEDIWGFEGGQAVGVGSGGMVNFDGDEWRDYGLRAHLYGVWGSSPHDVWAVGPGTMLHFDGQNWIVRDFEVGIPSFLDVLGFGPRDVYVISHNSMYRYDGFQWRLVLTDPQLSSFRCLTGTSNRDLYILADDSVYHYDGNELTTVHAPRTGERPHGPLWVIWSASSSSVFIGGDKGYLVRCASD
jgi:hypothetical protein